MITLYLNYFLFRITTSILITRSLMNYFLKYLCRRLMEKLMVINENLVHVRNKVANLYKKLSPDLLVIFKLTKSSATVGCIPTVASISFFFIPNLIAIANPYNISPAFGPK